MKSNQWVLPSRKLADHDNEYSAKGKSPTVVLFEQRDRVAQAESDLIEALELLEKCEDLFGFTSKYEESGIEGFLNRFK